MNRCSAYWQTINLTLIRVLSRMQRNIQVRIMLRDELQNNLYFDSIKCFEYHHRGILSSESEERLYASCLTTPPLSLLLKTLTTLSHLHTQKCNHRRITLLVCNLSPRAWLRMWVRRLPSSQNNRLTNRTWGYTTDAIIMQQLRWETEERERGRVQKTLAELKVPRGAFL